MSKQEEIRGRCGNRLICIKGKFKK